MNGVARKRENEEKNWIYVPMVHRYLTLNQALRLSNFFYTHKKRIHARSFTRFWISFTFSGEHEPNSFFLLRHRRRWRRCSRRPMNEASNTRTSYKKKMKITTTTNNHYTNVYYYGSVFFYFFFFAFVQSRNSDSKFFLEFIPFAHQNFLIVFLFLLLLNQTSNAMNGNREVQKKSPIISLGKIYILK